jgi:hypothetical protein
VSGKLDKGVVFFSFGAFSPAWDDWHPLANSIVPLSNAKVDWTMDLAHRVGHEVYPRTDGVKQGISGPV